MTKIKAGPDTLEWLSGQMHQLTKYETDARRRSSSRRRRRYQIFKTSIISSFSGKGLITNSRRIIFSFSFSLLFSRMSVFSINHSSLLISRIAADYWLDSKTNFFVLSTISSPSVDVIPSFARKQQAGSSQVYQYCCYCCSVKSSLLASWSRLRRRPMHASSQQSPAESACPSRSRFFHGSRSS